MNIQINSYVKFYLDGHIHGYGEGIVKNDIDSRSIELQLTTVCKEYPIGTMLIVDKNEIATN
jgi:hypothetical protein